MILNHALLFLFSKAFLHDLVGGFLRAVMRLVRNLLQFLGCYLSFDVLHHLVLEIIVHLGDFAAFGLRLAVSYHFFLLDVDDVLFYVELVAGLASCHHFFITAFGFIHSGALNGIIFLDDSGILARRNVATVVEGLHHLLTGRLLDTVLAEEGVVGSQ